MKDTGYRIQDTGVSKFTDLKAWQISHQLVIEIYKETIKFPKEEIYSIVSQLRRAAVSITSNIAEGFARFNKKEKTQFYRIAAGSVTEVQNQILISRDVGYLSNQVFLSLAVKTQDSIKLINGLIKSTLKTQNPESKILNPEDNKEDNSNSKEPSDE